MRAISDLLAPKKKKKKKKKKNERRIVGYYKVYKAENKMVSLDYQHLLYIKKHLVR